MAAPTHRYQARVRWLGNRGVGTRDYRSYGREHEVLIPGKPALAGSSDPAFRGDPALYNPEDLLLASLSACHMLWYLHLAAEAGQEVVDYVDDATASLVLDGRGGRFTEAVLRPRVTLAAGEPARADALHQDAHHACFIASSVNFPVRCEPSSVMAS